MATFNYLSYESYDRSGGGSSSSANYNAEGTLLDQAQAITDDMGDNTFTVGEVVNVPGFAGPLYFQGIISSTDGGGNPITLFVVSDGTTGGNSKLYVFSPTTVADTNYPAVVNEDTAATNATGGFSVCFGAGTPIATPAGETPVERLAIGDLVRTAAGDAVPVRWIGRQTLAKQVAGHRMQPVRIAAGALGHGLPHRDLVVTGDHGMILDGHVINASALVNGTSIALVPLNDLPESFSVYHVETEAHDVILAAGAPSETFVDAVTRGQFDNFDEYLALYGAERIIPEMPALRITTQRLLPASIRARLGIEELSQDTRLRA